LRDRLIEEFIVVTLVWRTVSVPRAFRSGRHRQLAAGILAAFSVMNWQGVNANIMS